MTTLPALPALGWVDWALLGTLLLSVLVGMVRGLLFELLALAGWVVAWFGAQWAAPQLAPHLPAWAAGRPGSALGLAAAFVLCFIGFLIVWGLLARLVRTLLRATPLSLPDRVLGGAFGALRGTVLLLALATVVALTPAAQSRAWRGSQGARWLQVALQGVKPLLPQPVVRWLPASLRSCKEASHPCAASSA